MKRYDKTPIQEWAEHPLKTTKFVIIFNKYGWIGIILIIISLTATIFQMHSTFITIINVIIGTLAVLDLGLMLYEVITRARMNRKAKK
ncbi:hypothetical protein ABVF11_00890 [Pediococcus argentinicus]|uniref:hypothetical protein n=1 Tax=Pediococcus argentinicus TaxID=480391 RepID=UPI00338F7EEF